ncbi:uncharacterized protein LOC135200399 [Macrobrachium nipponense]|uniref:uncharacterized protein LOC135200399 n=1 Tax=Macrobrachium nipponense TaxID=159736 RepID=UPI0030C7E9ED
MDWNALEAAVLPFISKALGLCYKGESSITGRFLVSGGSSTKDMSVRISLLVIISLVVFGCGAAPEGNVTAQDESALEIFRPEEPCSSEGGICGLESYCPAEDRFSEKGLCPTQREKGVECCRTVPLNLRACRSRGGECLPPEACGKTFREPHGVCTEGEVCCILL